MIDEAKGVKIWMYRNGDVFKTGKRMIVSSRVFKNYEQFLSQTSNDLNLLHGAVRKVYTMQGEEIKDLTGIKDGQCYVAAASGELFKKVVYNIPEELGKSRLLAGAGLGGGAGLIKLSLTKKPVVNRDQNDKPLFSATSKGYRVVVFFNGNDKHFDLKMVLNYRNCKSFERLLMTLSQIFQRRIRKLFDAETFARVRTLQDLKDGHNLVAATDYDPLKQLKYPIFDPLAPPAKVPEHLIPKVVTFYPNGDAYHHGYQLTVKKARYHTLQQLLDHLNHTIHLVTGRATRIYRLDNGAKLEESNLTPLFSTDKSAPTKFVLVSADDIFYNIKYDVNAYTRRIVFGEGGDQESAPVEFQTAAMKLKKKPKQKEVQRAPTAKPVEHAWHDLPMSRGKTPGGVKSPNRIAQDHFPQEDVKEFKSGSPAIKKRTEKPAKKQTVKYSDGSEIEVSDLPPLPNSPAVFKEQTRPSSEMGFEKPNSPRTVMTPAALKQKTRPATEEPINYANLPPLPMSPEQNVDPDADFLANLPPLPVSPPSDSTDY
ncbi:hypothetical protein HDU78_006423 [Chytriomyces hyalinus]|nr:hypothetical protein HDU78_006423 [Chytriomyces hyalinus]KAJ3252229.1 hypothetical protein HDU77_005265 [Chytriomyces hyalinus]